MNITNSQLKRIDDALNTLSLFIKSGVDFSKEREVLMNAKAALNELETKRAKENARSAKYLAKKRAVDPLYGRSDEYKRQRIEKAKRIIELYGKE